uniref:Premelanosome protein b n=1 Tax=Astyanax mexicanus TaxID=7994 RepID=A0A8B9R6V5_ASTMX
HVNVFSIYVKFDVRNDAPTLTGAKVTFNIDILFPANQMVLPDGQVVWARNCIVNGGSCIIMPCHVHELMLKMLLFSVSEGIESVEIVDASSTVLVADLEQNAVDFTVTCQGSLPTEVCTVVSDAECKTPGKTVCTSVSPSPECLLVLRHFFNDSGVFCINVSMTNDVSLAVTSARVNVIIGERRMGTIAMVLGVLVVASALGTVAFVFK